MLSRRRMHCPGNFCQSVRAKEPVPMRVWRGGAYSKRSGQNGQNSQRLLQQTTLPRDMAPEQPTYGHAGRRIVHSCPPAVILTCTVL